MVELEKHTVYGGERRPIVRNGRFRHSYKYEGIALLIWALISVAGIVAVWNFSYLLSSVDMLQEGEVREGTPQLMILLVEVWIIISAFAYAIISSGGLCYYSAGETEFTIKGPGKKQEIFYYNDVYEVRYDPIKLLFFDRGYLVTITTGVREITYRYLYGDGKRNRRIEDSPFYYLEYNSGLCEKDDNPPPDVELVKEMIAREGYLKSYESIKEDDDSFFA